jgi:nucleotide-binding universal stress UspA family protein
MTKNLRPIVVGYDDSPDADLALTWAVRNSRDRSQPTRVVIVADPVDPLFAEYQDLLDHSTNEWQLRAVDRLKELDAEHETIELRRGSPAVELIRASGDADMLVLGSRGHGLVAGSLSGSVTQHVARHADCPVVVARTPHTPHSHRIVVGVDGSSESAKALQFALERASRTGEDVVAVHGYRGVHRSSRTVFGPGISDEMMVRMEAAQRFLAEAVAGLAEDYPDVRLDAQAIPQPGARLLVDASYSASLVVVGSRGRDAFTGLLLGSVSQHVLGHADCPVAVIR